MKEEAKRQQPTTTDAEASPTEGNSGQNNDATEPTSTPDKGGSGSSPVTQTPSDPEASPSAVVNFLLGDSNRFENGLENLLKPGNDPVTVPLLLHPGLGEDSPFQVSKYVCGLNGTNQAVPRCHEAIEPKETGSLESRAENAEDNLVFWPLNANALFLRVNWSNPDDVVNTAGWSYSKLFTMAQGDRKSGEQEEAFLRTYAKILVLDPASNPNPILHADVPYEHAPAIQALVDAANAIPTASATPTTIRPAITDTAGREGDISDNTPTSASNANDNGGSGGLSQGAIIGIAVAAGIIGLAAIGLLVWFFCLRNRRRGSKDHGPYAAPDHQASEYMVNKETTGPHVTESPHSPYSDDGSLAHAQAHGSSSLAQAQQTNQYSDAPPIAAPVPRSASQQAGDRPGSGAGTRSDTPGGGHNVSHLIEEGMTEADIRRLEEEERALDDAIERAGHGRR